MAAEQVDDEKEELEEEVARLEKELAALKSDSQKGTLEVCIVEANLTRDTEVIGEMDPYVKVTHGLMNCQTKVLRDAGKTPMWRESFNLVIKEHCEKVVFEVLDEDVCQDDKVGQVAVDISKLINVDTWLELRFED